MFILEYITHLIDYILRDPFTQLSGFMAMGIILIAYFQKDDFTVKKLMLLSSLFWGTHFYLLGMYSGLAAIIIWVLRLLLSLKYERNYNAFLLIVWLTLITGYFTFDGVTSLLPVITSITWAYSYFFLEKIKLRIAMIFNSSTWLIYHISIGSVSGIMNEIFTHVILILTVYRMMHPEWGTHYYMQRIRTILAKRPKTDYDRFIFLHDRITLLRKKAGHHFLHCIHFDLRNLFSKKKYEFLHKIKH